MKHRRSVLRTTLALSAALALCSTITACAPAPQQAEVPVQTGVPAQDDWVTVATGDRTEVFVRPSSLQWQGNWLSVRTRQNFTEPQATARGPRPSRPPDRSPKSPRRQN